MRNGIYIIRPFLKAGHKIFHEAQVVAKTVIVLVHYSYIYWIALKGTWKESL